MDKIDKQLLLGAEAMAQAALDAESRSVCLSGTFYRNTEYIQQSPQAKSEDTIVVVDKTKNGLRGCFGHVICREKSMVCMKHGTECGTDAFMNSAITGVHGGLVVVVADDPSMHSSQRADSGYTNLP